MNVKLGAGMFSARPPSTLDKIRHETDQIAFDGASEEIFGMLLSALAASKPGGRFLELGTGTGLATSWLLAGMSSDSTLISVDVSEAAHAIAHRHLGSDPRLRLMTTDGLAFVESETAGGYDLVYADAWVGKFEGRAAAQALVRRGGFYVVDDLLPQPNWPENHQVRVDLFVREALASTEWNCSLLNWSSGILVMTKR